VRTVALTGGIATGKSHVLERFRQLGAACLDADELAHGVTGAGTEASQAIAERFGREMLDPSGAVDRRKLGPVVFADGAARRDLEAIVHPAVYRAIAAGLRAFELTGSTIAVVDIPLLYETAGERRFDRVVVTLCSPATQLARLLARGLSEEEARQRLAAQIPAQEKAGRADYVVRTDGTFADTDAQVMAIWRQLTTEATNEGG
jgi:dephospho-CoA kinase